MTLCIWKFKSQLFHQAHLKDVNMQSTGQSACKVWIALAFMKHTVLCGSSWHWHPTQTDTLSADKQHSELIGFACWNTYTVCQQHCSKSLHLICLYTNFNLLITQQKKMPGILHVQHRCSIKVINIEVLQHREVLISLLPPPPNISPKGSQSVTKNTLLSASLPVILQKKLAWQLQSRILKHINTKMTFCLFVSIGVNHEKRGEDWSRLPQTPGCVVWQAQ